MHCRNIGRVGGEATKLWRLPKALSEGTGAPQALQEIGCFRVRLAALDKRASNVRRKRALAENWTSASR